MLGWLGDGVRHHYTFLCEIQVNGCVCLGPPLKGFLKASQRIRIPCWGGVGLRAQLRLREKLRPLGMSWSAFGARLPQVSLQGGAGVQKVVHFLQWTLPLGKTSFFFFPRIVCTFPDQSSQAAVAAVGVGDAMRRCNSISTTSTGKRRHQKAGVLLGGVPLLVLLNWLLSQAGPHKRALVCPIKGTNHLPALQHMPSHSPSKAVRIWLLKQIVPNPAPTPSKIIKLHPTPRLSLRNDTKTTRDARPFRWPPNPSAGENGRSVHRTCCSRAPSSSASAGCCRSWRSEAREWHAAGSGVIRSECKS